MPTFVFIDLQSFVIKYGKRYLNTSKFGKDSCTFRSIMFKIIFFSKRGKTVRPKNLLGSYSNMKFPFLEKKTVLSATAAIVFRLVWSPVKWMNY